MPGRIHYFATANHTYTLGIFAAFYAEELTPDIRLIPYYRLRAIRSFGPGTFIFTDFDRLPDAARQPVATLIEHLKASGCRVLNHPEHTLGRFDLLSRLHEAGINRFGVHRLSGWRDVRRFPVFIRQENVHGQLVTGLLPDVAALQAAVDRLSNIPSPTDDMMIVEFGNERDADGMYGKYAAYRVGQRIYAQHFSRSEDWCVNLTSADRSDSTMRAHEHYVQENPHADQLAPIFDLAGTDYGRADYALIDGRVQLFEINTNPTIVHATSEESLGVSLYARLHREALAELLASGSGPAEITNPLFSASEREFTLDELHTRHMNLMRSREYRQFDVPKMARPADISR